MLIAFRDNAEELLGSNADRMIPFQASADVGWTADPIFTSFIPNAITEREWYKFGFDDRRFTMPNVKEGFRVLNNWYHEGLLFNDFALYDAQDPIFDDNIKLGFVGALAANWDYPYRESPGLISGMQEEVGPDANFIVVTPFPNDSGRQVMHMPLIDRQIVLPATGKDPLAALLYIDFMSRPETIAFLSFGVEGINHTRAPDGLFLPIHADDIEDDSMLIPSVRNYDLNLMIGANGVFTGDANLDLRQRASALPGFPIEVIQAAIQAQESHQRIMRPVQVGDIEEEGMYGAGLSSIRDEAMTILVARTSADDFDAAWERHMANYLSSGGQAIIDARDAAWVRTFGDVPNMPED